MHRRPVPAEIRKLAIEARARRQPRIDMQGSQEERAAHQSRRAARDAEMIAEGKAVGAAWAKERGFPDLQAYADANGIAYQDACCRIIKGNLAAFAERQRMSRSEPRMDALREAAGVTAREIHAEETPWSDYGQDAP